MLHKYYLIVVSNNFNLKFKSNTIDDGVWIIPNIRQNLRYVIENAVEEDAELAVVLDGYK